MIVTQINLEQKEFIRDLLLVTGIVTHGPQNVLLAVVKLVRMSLETQHKINYWQFDGNFMSNFLLRSWKEGHGTHGKRLGAQTFLELGKDALIGSSKTQFVPASG